MPPGNQDEPSERSPDAAPSPPEPAPSPDPGGAEPSPAHPRAYATWLALLVVLGLGGLLLGQAETAALAAFAGLFVAAHGADLQRDLALLHRLTAWIAPAGGVAACLALAGLVGGSLDGGAAGAGSGVRVGACVAAAVLVIASAFPAPGAALARRLLGEGEPTSRVARLAARLVVVALAVGVCGMLAYGEIQRLLLETTEPLFESGDALGGILGYVLVALAGVGFLVRRALPATLARLGLEAPRPRELVLVPVAVIALLAINAGAETIQQRWFPALADADARVSALVARDLTIAGALLLGLTAGLGEELTLRGALQPRLGILSTSLVFAVLHVQYSWFGIVVVFALGLVFGVIRRYSSTTIAIAVHALYDVVVALAIRQG